MTTGNFYLPKSLQKKIQGGMLGTKKYPQVNSQGAAQICNSSKGDQRISPENHELPTRNATVSSFKMKLQPNVLYLAQKENLIQQWLDFSTLSTHFKDSPQGGICNSPEICSRFTPEGCPRGGSGLENMAPVPENLAKIMASWKTKI